MTLVIPESVPVDGTRTVRFVPTIADPAALKLTEVNAVSSKDIGCYITGDGWNPTTDQASIADPRLCSPQDFEQPGRETNGLSIRYVFNLNEETDDVARITLPKGTTGYLVNRLQKDASEAWEVEDWYEAWPVKAGVQTVMPSEANAVDRIDQKVFITGPVVRFRQVVAGS
jgi:hypothetical protein